MHMEILRSFPYWAEAAVAVVKNQVAEEQVAVPF
jgi:hypothetical protein